jgi:hypothetical protein
MRVSSGVTAVFVMAFLLVCSVYFAITSIVSDTRLVEVRGLSEKVVRADSAVFNIVVSNKNQNIDELYKKLVADREKVVAFLKANNITEAETKNSSLRVTEVNEYENNQIRGKCYKSSELFKIQTRELEKVENLKAKIIDLMKQRVFLSYGYSYKLSNFSDIKLKMMEEASRHARSSAEAIAAPQNQQIGEAIYLRQGETSIKAENDNGSGSYSDESSSLNKKLRLVVLAGFKKK